MRNPGKGRLLTFEPSSGNWRKNLGTDIRNGSVKRYPIIGIPFGLRPHSIPIMGNDTVNGILPLTKILRIFIWNFMIFLKYSDSRRWNTNGIEALTYIHHLKCIRVRILIW